MVDVGHISESDVVNVNYFHPFLLRSFYSSSERSCCSLAARRKFSVGKKCFFGGR